MHGMPAATGYSVLVSIEGIQNPFFQKFFHNSCNYPGQNSENSLFELKGVKCHRNISLSNSLDINTISNDHEQQTKQVSYRKRKQICKAKRKKREKRNKKIPLQRERIDLQSKERKENKKLFQRRKIDLQSKERKENKKLFQRGKIDMQSQERK